MSPAAEPLPAGPLLGRDFYDRSVHDVARDLIGCTLVVDGVGGVIVETESYHQSEPACHAYAGLTPRTAPLFGPPGNAYVYLSYGVHDLLNAVAEPKGVGTAALIRAIEPRWGLDRMRERRGLEADRLLCAGPGRLTQALGITRAHNELPLDKPPFELRAPNQRKRPEIVAGPRIGITRAVDLPWRFCAAGSSRYVSHSLPR